MQCIAVNGIAINCNNNKTDKHLVQQSKRRERKDRNYQYQDFKKGTSQEIL